MEIVTKEYSVIYDAETTTIYLQGVMRLNSKEYEPIVELLNQIVALEPSLITVNLSHLKMLNSSGISMLGRFVFIVGKKNNIQLTIQGTDEFTWQKRWVKNFQRLMPNLQLEFK